MTNDEKKELVAQLQRARGLPEAFLDCRSLRHAWREVLPDHQAVLGEQHTYQCTRCLTIREDVVAPRWGELLGRSYRYVPDYEQPRPADGSRPFSAAALRAERSRRIKEEARKLPPILPLPTVDE